jgi:sigma-E factor negative regulatory protein RseA
VNVNNPAPKNERLSALIDGEASEFEQRRLIDQCLRSAEDRDQWERFHLVRDAIRGNMPDAIDPSFADRIMARIDAEGSAPAAAQTPEGPSRVRSVAQFAMAASVAVVAVVVGMRALNDTGPEVATPQFAQAPAPAQGAAPRQLVQLDDDSLRTAGRLNAYLVSHSSYATMHGVMPDARRAPDERRD